NYFAKFVNGTYDSRSHFETSGVVSLFWSSTIDATANGNIQAHAISPALYDSWSQDHNSKKQQVKVTFGEAEPVTFANPPYNTTKYPVTAEQKKGAIDPMTAITAVFSGIRADAKNPCGTGIQVFDGRRRYDVTLQFLRDEQVTGVDVYGGIGHIC